MSNRDMFDQAAALQQAGRLADAERSLAVVPNQVEALVNRGKSLRLPGRFDRALEAFSRALSFDATLEQSAFKRNRRFAPAI